MTGSPLGESIMRLPPRHEPLSVERDGKAARRDHSRQWTCNQGAGKARRQGWLDRPASASGGLITP